MAPPTLVDVSKRRDRINERCHARASRSTTPRGPERLLTRPIRSASPTTNISKVSLLTTYLLTVAANERSHPITIGPEPARELLVVGGIMDAHGRFPVSRSVTPRAANGKKNYIRGDGPASSSPRESRLLSYDWTSTRKQPQNQ
jgi:hypothetical protein